MVTVNITFSRAVFRVYSISFLMMCRLIDFAQWFSSYWCLNGIIGISKIEFLNFSWTERVKQSKKIQKPFKISKACQTITFQAMPTKAKHLFLVFHWNFNPFAPCDSLCGSKYQPIFEQQYLKNGKGKQCFQENIFRGYSTSFLMIFRLIQFSLVVL